MGTFDAGDVVRVPFPYTDRPVRQHRPALVVSTTGLGESGLLIWVVMITSAENRPWPGDVSFGGVENSAKSGLPASFVVRPSKIATIESREAERLGQIDSGMMRQVRAELAAHLGLS